tara:strand:- start:107 stop:634 length:528 start_codon:yes stop_codon:yes gene_type:complete
VLQQYHFDTVLDVGCAQGHLVEHFRNRGKDSRGIDVSTIAVKRAKKLGRDCSWGSVTDIPFGDKSFDLVYCTDVMEHLRPEDVSTAIDELYRVTKKFLAISVSTNYSTGITGDKARRGAYFKAKLQGKIDNLHLTIKPMEWWLDQFKREGINIRYRKRKMRKAFIAEIKPYANYR